MIISLIVAMEEDNGIGLKDKVPWHLPDDLKNFKQVTMGHHLVVGRKTFETINRPLPGRFSLVITRQVGYRSAICPPESCRVMASLEQALSFAEGRGESEVFVIGGGEIYALALPLAHRLYLTRIHTSLPCDAFFPQTDLSTWKEVSRLEHLPDARHALPFTFLVLEKPSHLDT